MKSHSASPNRRNAYRLSITTGKNRIEVTGGESPIELIDLSTTGGRLLYRGLAADEVSERLPLPLAPLEIRLPNGDRVKTRASVVRQGSAGPGMLQVGARWCSLADEDRSKLQRFIACARLRDNRRTLTVKNPMFIRNLLAQRLDSMQPILSVIDRDLRLGSQLQVESVAFEEGRRVIRARVMGDALVTLAKERSYEFVLGGAAVTTFESSCLDQQGRDITLTVPAEVSQKSGRDSRRVALGGPTALSVSLVMNGCRPNPHIDGAVVDLAARGLRFRFDRADHDLELGGEIATLDIQLPTRRLTARAVVRSLIERGSAVTCGVELLKFSDADEDAAWRRFVFDHMHPNLLDGRSRAERTWNVLDASKYVELWTDPQTRDHARAQYLEAWQTTASEVGHSLLLCRRDIPVGVIAASVVYPRSFIIHHLGRDSRDDGKSQAGLKESSDLLCGILQRLKAETDLEHFLIYFERDKRFNEGLYVDFAERYFDKSKVMITSNEVYRRSTALPLHGDPSGVDVVPATPKLVAELTARLAVTTTALERQAMALDEARIELAEFEQACGERSYQRKRTIFFALVDGRPQAALIAELGSEGVNIFGLLNTCRIIGLSDIAAPSAAVRAALLARATEHYRQADKRNFLFLDEPGPGDGVPGRLGFQHISGGLRWIAHRDVVPAWSAYLDGLLAASPATSAPRPPRPVQHNVHALAQGIEQ